MKKKILLLFIALITVLFLYTVVAINREKDFEIQGQIEFREIKVSSKIVGRIDSLPVRKGSIVSKGDLLYKISSPEIDAKSHQAKSANLAAISQEIKAKNGAQKEDILAAKQTTKRPKQQQNYGKTPIKE